MACRFEPLGSPLRWDVGKQTMKTGISLVFLIVLILMNGHMKKLVDCLTTSGRPSDGCEGQKVGQELEVRICKGPSATIYLQGAILNAVWGDEARDLADFLRHCFSQGLRCESHERPFCPKYVARGHRFGLCYDENAHYKYLSLDGFQFSGNTSRVLAEVLMKSL